MPLTLFQDDFHKIEHHFAQGTSATIVACTFTPFNFYSFDNEGFGVKYMLSRGYDVIAFKCINDSWFQQIPLHILQAVGAISARYERVVTYGSSMGGYAAIAFSKVLRASSIIAISPQFAIDEPSDRRWVEQARNITWRYRIDPDNISARSMYLLYDDKMKLEVQHILKIIEVAKKINEIHHLKFSLSGHPTGTFLAQTGMITQVVSNVLDEKTISAPSVGWSKLRKSSAYFLSLSQLARSKGKHELEILALKKAVHLRPDHVLAQNLLKDALARRLSSNAIRAGEMA